MSHTTYILGTVHFTSAKKSYAMQTCCSSDTHSLRPSTSTGKFCTQEKTASNCALSFQILHCFAPAWPQTKIWLNLEILGHIKPIPSHISGKSGKGQWSNSVLLHAKFHFHCCILLSQEGPETANWTKIFGGSRTPTFTNHEKFGIKDLKLSKTNHKPWDIQQICSQGHFNIQTFTKLTVLWYHKSTLHHALMSVKLGLLESTQGWLLLTKFCHR